MHGGKTTGTAVILQLEFANGLTKGQIQRSEGPGVAKE